MCPGCGVCSRLYSFVVNASSVSPHAPLKGGVPVNLATIFPLLQLLPFIETVTEPGGFIAGLPVTVPSQIASWNERSVYVPLTSTSRITALWFVVNSTPSDHVPPNGA